MEPIGDATTSDDIAYVRANYRTLDELERGEPLIELERRAGVSMPRASYRIGDELYYAPDWWQLADDAGGTHSPGELRALFERRYIARSASLMVAVGEIAEDWRAYLAGLYGVCLYQATPENIVTKAVLVERLDARLADPRPRAADWCAALRDDVDALAAISRPFAACDRARFGRPTTRDRLVAAPRAAYPHAFA